jgi:integrase
VKFRHVDGTVTRKRQRSRVNSKRAAEALEREIIASLATGKLTTTEQPQPTAETLQQFAPRVLEFATTNNKPSEQESKQSILTHHLIPAFGTLRLDEITTQRIESYKREKLRDGYSAKSLNNHLTVLRLTLSIAQQHGQIASLPTLRRLKETEPKFRFLSDAESASLTKACASIGVYGAMAILAMQTGLRIGELLALQWDDVGPDALAVRRAFARNKLGTPKGGRSRVVPLTHAARVVLRALRESKSSQWVFAIDGEPLRRAQVKRPLWTAAKSAGIGPIGWHVLRHTFASHLVQRGCPLFTVSQLLGHRDVKTTLRYAHLAPATLQSAVSMLDSVGPSQGQHPTVH